MRQVLGRKQLTAVYWCNDETGTESGTVNNGVSVGVMMRQVLGRVQLTAVYWCNDETGTGSVTFNSGVLV